MSYAAAPYRAYTQLPSDKQIAAIPLSRNAEFSLSGKETSALRRHIYAINKSDIRRYRTMRDLGPSGPVLLVWRIK